MLERGEAPEFVKALVDFIARKRSETLDAELFAAEAAHDRAIDDRAMQLVHIEMAVAKVESALGKIADESSRETIARAGGIEYIFQEDNPEP